MKNKVTKFLVTPVLLLALVGCAPQVELPEGDTGPSGIGAGINPAPLETEKPGDIQVGSEEEQKELEQKNKEEAENKDFPLRPDNYNWADPATTLPKLDATDPGFDVNNSVLNDIQATRLNIVNVLTNNNATGMKMDGKASGETTMVNAGTADPLVVYQAVITHPATTITTSGKLGDYKIVVENSETGYTVTYDSFTNTYK